MRILGLGNELRGDDALGILAARKIKQARPDLQVDTPGDTAGILNCLDQGAQLILIDCLQGAGALGSLHRIDLLKDGNQKLRSAMSSHGFDLPSLLELAGNLGATPASLVLFGLEGQDFTLGQGLSALLEENLEELCQGVIQEAQNA